MNRIRWYGPTLVLLIAVLLVMVAGPGVAKRIAFENKAAHIQLVRDGLSSNPTLAELSDSFRKVAQVVEPSVVHIQVASRAPQRNRMGPGMDEDMLRRFFGPRFRMEPEEPRRDDREMEKYNVPRPFGNGSGWVYDAKHVVTNYHVVESAEEITLRFHDGSERTAKVKGSDPKTDVAVLEVSGGNLHPATLARESVQQGDIVFAFGSPFRFEFSMSQGIVSGKGRQLGILQGRQGYENFIQTDAAINPGNSGGPLTNIYGEVVGMNTAIATQTGSYNGLGFAIPVDEVRDVVEQLIATGSVTRGYLGVFIEDLDPRMAKTFGFEGKGVLVVNPIEGGPGEAAGLKQGDIITHIEGKPVTTSEMLRRRVARVAPGTTLSLEVFRDGRTQRMEITVGQLPDEVGVASNDQPNSGRVNPQHVEVLRKIGLESVATHTPELAERLGFKFTPGVIIEDVRDGSAAAAAGLLPRAVILNVMGAPVKDTDELVTELNKHDLTQGVRLRVQYGDVSRFVLLELPKQ